MEGEVAIVELQENLEQGHDLPFWNYTSISLEGEELGRVEQNLADCSNHEHIYTPKFDLTFLIAAGGSLGVLVTIWILYRAYHLLLVFYCRSLTRQCMDRDTPSNTSIETIYVIDSCRETRGRVRGVGAGVQGMAGVLARMQSYKKGESPPPPYDSPPPYHVAITMGNVPDVVMSEPINI
ncbi:uncharacterized protein LOC111707346 [Eurytemora carolleeae]|uniref:uncharacterized protein LOC111707346 n=1 Tax=Eurytemora carolleeae TaxID=1294199 RepID=UPI000C7723CB|nr:uncharacterized protein LOC111707346 [Eurytemora carolleeae]|eukprot:XP_023336207.1 uncharacterized protein LOC111707346 [Eurytemora affinis]